MKGKTAAFIGRLGTATQVEAARWVTDAGGKVRRGLGRTTDLAVIGHGAHTLLEAGRLQARVVRAQKLRIDVVSENAFLRRLGRMESQASAARSISAPQIQAKSGLAADALKLLALFDVVETGKDGMFGFRDLVAAREVAGLLASGAGLAEVIASVYALGPGADDGNRLSQVKLVRAEDGIVIRMGQGTADLDGQMLLALPATGDPSADDLFEGALSAEEDGHLDLAAGLYERCLGVDRRDPSIAFNLANVLRDLGETRQARLHYQIALDIDRRFVDARFNLAHLDENAGNLDAATTQLRAAIDLDPTYADALFNLAGIYYRQGALAGAAKCWEQYLEIDDQGEWAAKARQALDLVRQQLG